MGNEVEKWGRGYKKEEIESDGDIDSNNDSEDQSEGGDDQFDESGDDDDDGNDGDEDNDGYDSDDNKYMRGFGVIKFVDDKIYEQADPKLDVDNEDIEIDGDVYKLCGSIYGNGGHTLYNT